MNNTNHMHESMKGLWNAARGTSRDIEILAKRVDVMNQQQQQQQNGPDAGASHAEIEQLVKEAVKTALTREKAIMEASLNHKMDQQVARVLEEAGRAAARVKDLEAKLAAHAAHVKDLEAKLATLATATPATLSANAPAASLATGRGGGKREPSPANVM